MLRYAVKMNDAIGIIQVFFEYSAFFKTMYKNKYKMTMLMDTK